MKTEHFVPPIFRLFSCFLSFFLSFFLSLSLSFVQVTLICPTEWRTGRKNLFEAFRFPLTEFDSVTVWPTIHFQLRCQPILTRSLSRSLSLYFLHYLFVSISPSLSISFSLCVCIVHSLSLHTGTYFSLSQSFSLFHSLSIDLFLFICLALSLSLFFQIFVSLSVSLFVSVCPYLSFSLSLYDSLSCLVCFSLGLDVTQTVPILTRLTDLVTPLDQSLIVSAYLQGISWDSKIRLGLARYELATSWLVANELPPHR